MPTRVQPGLSRWIARRYPEYSHAYWGQSGAALLFDALCQEQRKTILMPAFICPSLPAMSAAAGLKVVFVDVEQNTLLPSFARLEQCLAEYPEATSVLLIDHSFGYPFASLAELRRRHPRLLIIEDCARALGSHIRGRPVGQTGDWTLLSLYKTVRGNNHGAVLLTQSPYKIRSGPAPATTLRQWASTARPLRALHGLVKRSHPDFNERRRSLTSPQWTPIIGMPNQLCLNRFALAVDRLEAEADRWRQAAAEIREALGDLGALRFVEPAAGCDTGAYFLSFTVAEDVDRNALLTRLHRRGFFLLRTWDTVPALFECFADAFPFGAARSVLLADHVGHIPVDCFLEPGPRQRLVEAFRECILTGAARHTAAHASASR